MLTTLCDPDQARADELAAAYHQRWEEETGNDQLKPLPRLKRMLGRSADLRCRDRKVLSDVGEVRYFVHDEQQAVDNRADRAVAANSTRI